MLYVALLRGINVGGNNKVDMKTLKATFEKQGLHDVKTYINSGNIIFRDDDRTEEQLATLLEKSIEKEFGFSVRVLVVSQKHLEKIENAIPANWSNDDAMKCDVMFLWRGIDEKNIIDELPIRPSIDWATYVKGAVIWSVERKNATKSGLPKLIGTKTYKEMTIRNCNTVRKLVALLQEMKS